MINNCEEDRIDMAKEIAEVRKGGSTNMFDRTNVIKELFNLGFDWTAEYIQDNQSDFISLLKLSGKY